MLETRQAFFEDFLRLDMDAATRKQLPTAPSGEGPIDNCTAAYWRNFENVQAIYGIVWEGKRAELAMAVSEWIRHHHPVCMARMARAEVPRLIADLDYDDIWARAPDGFDYVPRWLRFVGFVPTGERTVDDEADWYRWAQQH